MFSKSHNKKPEPNKTSIQLIAMKYPPVRAIRRENGGTRNEREAWQRS